jgi:hypothetical protein
MLVNPRPVMTRAEPAARPTTSHLVISSLVLAELVGQHPAGPRPGYGDRLNLADHETK